MFESLSDRLSSTFRSLSGRAQLTEENIREGLREVVDFQSLGFEVVGEEHLEDDIPHIGMRKG